MIKYNPVEVNRPTRFLFQHPTLGYARFLITESDMMELVAKNLGEAIRSSFEEDNPIRGLLLFGQHGTGKSSVAACAFSQFKGAYKESFNSKNPIERFSNVYPKCLHMDYWRYEGIHKLMYDQYQLEDGEVLISEWSDAMPSPMVHPDRIEIELLKCDNVEDAWKNPKATLVFDRNNPIGHTIGDIWIASIVGYGFGLDAVEHLKTIEKLMPIQLR